MNFNFLKYKNIYFTISTSLVILSIISFVMYGLNFGIDFSQGAVLNVAFQDKAPQTSQIKDVIAQFTSQETTIRLIGDNSAEITFLLNKKQQSITQEDRAKIENIKAELNKEFKINPDKTYVEEVSSVVGSRVQQRTWEALLYTTIFIILFVWIAFKKVSRPVSSWMYGVAAVIALLHDVIIPVGIFSLLGHFYGIQFTLPIVTALLTVYGYSVMDTIVVFDRIRENLLRRSVASFEDAINKSLNEVAGRSLATSVTTLLPLFAIYFFGGESLKYFALALLLGITFGTYSSIFLASPLLLIWSKDKLQTNKK